MPDSHIKKDKDYDNDTASPDVVVAAQPYKSRSVNDFDTTQGIRAALIDVEKRSDYVVDVGRDFPRALIGSTLGVPREDDDMSECSTVFAAASHNNDDGDDDAAAALDWMLTNQHADTSNIQTLEHELNRLEVLKSYLILDSQREASFERLTSLAARIFSVPIALVSLVDLGRQWFMSNRGLGDVRETPRKLAFCAHAIISQQDLLIVPDATRDDRFQTNPLVTGPPHIRFYGGAPLICPEGYKLGTLCLIDTKTRPNGMTLDEKQTLRELAALVVETMVQRRNEKMRVLQDKSQIIATTAHDLLTPLSGLQMSLSLLLEDEELQTTLSSSHNELLDTAVKCGSVMQRICNNAIATFRGNINNINSDKSTPLASSSLSPSSSIPNNNSHHKYKNGFKPVVVADMVKSLNMVMSPFPKSVPLFISVDPLVPPKFVSDDLKVFRSAVNFLTNALSKTKRGNVHLKIYVAGKKTKPKLVFECEDTGPGIALEQYPFLFRPFRGADEQQQESSSLSQEEQCIRVGASGKVETNTSCHVTMSHSGLGLYSVANQISSMGGEYGFRPRDAVPPPPSGTASSLPSSETTIKNNNDQKHSGSIFWFSIPLIVPSDPVPEEGDKPNRGTGINHPNHLTPTSSNGGGRYSNNISNSNSGSRLPSVRVLSTTALSEADSAEICTTIHKILALEHVREDANPKAANDEQTGPAITIAPSALEMSSGGKRTRRALVIDDSIVIRKSISRALSRLGFDVNLAVNGLEGLKQLQQQVFDVVLCDYLMPVMDGLDCVQQYRDWEEAHRPWFRQFIVGISAHASASDVDKGMRAGMNEFKPKPVTMMNLKELESSDQLREISARLDDILSFRGADGGGDAGAMDTDEDGDEDESCDSQNPADASREERERRRCVNVAAQRSAQDGPVCLLAEPAGNTVMKEAVENLGWHAVTVNDGEDALRLLKMRNWDAVFMENEIPRLTGHGCMERFRVWENDNRVARQNNVYLLTTDFVPSPDESMCAVYPPGFDGALGKPILMKDLKGLLNRAEVDISDSASSWKIVAR